MTFTNKFKVGDTVRMIEEHNKPTKGSIGTVVKVNNSCDYGIEFDNAIGGHDCNGRCKDKHGWFCYEEDIELVSREPFKGDMGAIEDCIISYINKHILSNIDIRKVISYINKQYNNQKKT